MLGRRVSVHNAATLVVQRRRNVTRGQMQLHELSVLVIDVVRLREPSVFCWCDDAREEWKAQCVLLSPAVADRSSLLILEILYVQAVADLPCP